MKKNILMLVGLLIGSFQIIQAQEYNGLPDFSDNYVKKKVALIDVYVRSISAEKYVRELFFKNFGNESLPTVVSYGEDLFVDDGSRLDQVAGDGVYSSAESYEHTSLVTYTDGRSISVFEKYAITDNVFQHQAELDDFLSSYEVPTRDRSILNILIITIMMMKVRYH